MSSGPFIIIFQCCVTTFSFNVKRNKSSVVVVFLLKKCKLTGAGQRHHVGGLGRRADPPAVGGSDPELVVTTGYEAVDLNALLPAAGRLLPQQRVCRRKNRVGV